MWRQPGQPSCSNITMSAFLPSPFASTASALRSPMLRSKKPWASRSSAVVAGKGNNMRRISKASLDTSSPHHQSNRKQIHELVHCHRLELFRIVAHVQNRVLLFDRELAREVGPELRLEQRDAILAAAAMARSEERRVGKEWRARRA